MNELWKYLKENITNPDAAIGIESHRCLLACRGRRGRHRTESARVSSGRLAKCSGSEA